jgi:cation diffusion facilitator CzcD-associated flavoprotein CzcO
VVFEQGARSGGLWADVGAGSQLYPSLRTNSSKYTFAFSVLPFPDAASDYPSWSEMRAYLQQYVVHAGLQPYLRCNTAVEALEPTGEGQWSVRTCTEETTQTETFDAVVVCSGRNQTPSLPPFTGVAVSRWALSTRWKQRMYPR